MSHQAVLLEEFNCNGNLQAVVEMAHGSIFFYLYADPETEIPMKSVWVRNLIAAPESLDVKGMREGTTPLNPAPFCRHPQGMSPPSAEDLSVIWLPEGNGVALCERDEILAIIPPWSGVDGFDGYAREQLGDGPLAWELCNENILLDRFSEANRYWEAWRGELWKTTQEFLLERISKAFGNYSNYYAIDGGNWPPKALVRIPRAEGTVLITLGVSLRPQPNVELSTDSPQLLRRVELAALTPSSWTEDQIRQFARLMSSDSKYPWDYYTWLGPGHTIACSGWSKTIYDAALLVRDHPVTGEHDLGPILGDPVNVLWYYPITDAERELAVAQGSDQLFAKLPTNRWQDA